MIGVGVLNVGLEQLRGPTFQFPNSLISPGEKKRIKEALVRKAYPKKDSQRSRMKHHSWRTTSRSEL